MRILCPVCSQNVRYEHAFVRRPRIGNLASHVRRCQFQWLRFHFDDGEPLAFCEIRTVFLGSLMATPRSCQPGQASQRTNGDDNAATSMAKWKMCILCEEIVIYSTIWREAGFQVSRRSYRTRKSTSALCWWFIALAEVALSHCRRCSQEPSQLHRTQIHRHFGYGTTATIFSQPYSGYRKMPSVRVAI